MTTHFDTIPEEQFEKLMDVIKASINGMIQAAEENKLCVSCLCHLIAAVANQTADDYAEVPGSVKPNVEGTSDAIN